MLSLLLLVALFLSISSLLWSYFVSLRSLRRFPSPSIIAAITPLWRIYHNYRMDQFLAIHNAHARLGTHVRIAPKHISVVAPEAVEAVYGHGTNCLKDEWYDGGAGEVRTMADTRSKTEHQSKRKRMAHIFSQKSILELEPLITERVDCLLRQVTKAAQSSGQINIRRYVNYFTIDVITAVMFGSSASTLERGSDVVPAETIDGRIYEAPLIQSLHDSMGMTVPMGYTPALHAFRPFLFRLHPLSRSAKAFEDIVRCFVSRGFEKFTSDEPHSERSHFLHQIEHEKSGRRRNLPRAELEAECSGMINAGSDTTSTALSNAIWLLYQPRNRSRLDRLRAELQTCFPETGKELAVPTFDSLAKLPYLRACIDETLRIRPSSAFGLPREIPPGGRTIAGQFVPAGTSISVPTYSILHDATIFRDPEIFLPERWVDSNFDDLVTMKKFHIPFSVGPRACIGRNIAYFEMTLTVATLVYHFDFEYVRKDVVENYRVLERLNANPDELMMLPRFRFRSG